MLNNGMWCECKTYLSLGNWLLALLIHTGALWSGGLGSPKTAPTVSPVAAKDCMQNKNKNIFSVLLNSCNACCACSLYYSPPEWILSAE